MHNLCDLLCRCRRDTNTGLALVGSFQQAHVDEKRRVVPPRKPPIVS